MILMAVMTAVLQRQTAAECIAFWKDIPEAKRQAALVFSGTVVERKPHPHGSAVVFDVDRVWKGSVQRRHVLPLYIWIESFEFQEGETYVVFANRYQVPSGNSSPHMRPSTSGPLFEISICSATRRLSESQTTLMQLGPGSKPKSSGLPK
jgi:hypothetical protein